MRVWCYIGGFFVSDENFQKIYCPLGQSITIDNEFDWKWLGRHTLILSSQICYGMGKIDHRNQEAKYNGPGS